MKTKIVRVAQGKESTLSHLYIDGIFQCFLLEDKIRQVKIKSKTAIPEGKFQLKVNTTGGMNRNYSQKYGQMHQGMIEIDDLPTFDAVFLSSDLATSIKTETIRFCRAAMHTGRFILNFWRQPKARIIRLRSRTIFNFKTESSWEVN